MQQTVNERVKKLREHLGLERSAFAKEIDMDASNYGKWEKGADMNVGFKTIKLISEKWNVSADWLLAGTGEMLLSAGKANQAGDPSPLSYSQLYRMWEDEVKERREESRLRRLLTEEIVKMMIASSEVTKKQLELFEKFSA